MNRFLQASLLAPLLLLSACVIAVHDRDYDDESYPHQREEARNRERIADLALGTPRAEVQRQFGEPAFTEAFRREDGDYRVLRYRTHRSHADGDTTRDETTALVFRDDVLIGIGDAAAERALNGA